MNLGKRYSDQMHQGMRCWVQMNLGTEWSARTIPEILQKREKFSDLNISHKSKISKRKKNSYHYL